MKLYFMIGLPGETMEGCAGHRRPGGPAAGYILPDAQGKRAGFKLTVSVACFVPKPHTPFQWARRTAL